MTSDAPGLLEVRGLSAEQIGTLAAESRGTLYELTPVTASLENAYLQLTEDSVQYRAEDTDANGHRTEQRIAA